MVNMSLNNSRSSINRGARNDRPPVRENCKVYVSNIDFGITHHDIKDLFSEVGEVAFVEMLKDNNDRPKGCAIVRYRDPECVEQAFKKFNRKELNGRKIVVKDDKDVQAFRDVERSFDRGGGGDRDRKRARDDDLDRSRDRGRPDANQGNTFGLSAQFLESLRIELPLNNSVFVANLDYTIDEDALRPLFEIAGKVEDIEVARGDDGKSRGFAFIEYEHPVEAVQAVSMLHNQTFRERTMNVQITKKEVRKDRPARLPAGLKSVGMGLGVNGAPLKKVAKMFEAGEQQSLMGAMPLTGAGAQLGVGNMGLNTNLGLNLSGVQTAGLNNLLSQGALANALGAGGLAGLGTGSLVGNLGAAGSLAGNFGSSGLAAGLSSGLNNLGLNSGVSNPGSNSIHQNSGGSHERYSQQSDRYPQQSDRYPQETDRYPQQSDRYAQQTDRFAPQSDRYAQQTDRYPQQSTDRNSQQSNPSGGKASVQISHLPPDYAWKSLQNLCASFGEVIFAKITSKGNGLVRFNDERSAKRAADMLDQQRFEGRYLETRLV